MKKLQRRFAPTPGRFQAESVAGLLRNDRPICAEYAASAQRQRSEFLAQDFTTDPVDHDVCAVTACDTSHAATQLLDGGINDLIESERLRLLGFRMIGRLEMACFAPKARANCVTALPTDPPIAGASTVLPA
jgi:hypothetical protein